MDSNDKKDILDAINTFAGTVQGQFDNVQTQFEGVNGRIDGLTQSFNNLQTSVDAYAKKAETIFEELVSVNNAIKRHEKWIEQIAEKLEIKLEY